MSPAVTPQEWDDLPPETQDELIASGVASGTVRGPVEFRPVATTVPTRRGHRVTGLVEVPAINPRRPRAGTSTNPKEK